MHSLTDWLAKISKCNKGHDNEIWNGEEGERARPIWIYACQLIVTRSIFFGHVDSNDSNVTTALT